jgi:hypothetical protein
MKKRKLPQADEDSGVRTSPVASRPATPTKFIGPLLPSPSIPSPSKKRKTSDSQDPQAEALKKKIEAITRAPKEAEKEKQPKKAPTSTSALQSLLQYADDDDGDDDDDDDDDDDGDDGEDKGEAPSPEEIEKAKEKLPIPLVDSSISTSNFYSGGSSNATPFKNRSNLPQQHGSPKRNRSEGAGPFKRRKPIIAPYSRLSGSNLDNLRRGSAVQYGRRKKKLIM